MASFDFEDLRGVSGLWEAAQVALRTSAAESAAGGGDWRLATERLLPLADALHATPRDSAAWRCLARETLRAALRTDDPSLVRVAAGATLEDARTLPQPVQRRLLRLAEEAEALAAGRELAGVLTRVAPRSPWGPYGTAHFLELTAGAVESTQVVSHFVRAAELFDSDARRAEHCRVRAAVALLRSHDRSEEGRAMARSIDRSALSADDMVWLAWGLTASPFWLDRVRGYDHFIDAMRLRGRRNASVAGVVVDPFVPAIFATLGPALEDTEVERLDELVELIPEEAREALRARLRARLALGEVRDRPLDEVSCDEAEALDVSPGLGLLVAAWRGEPRISEPGTGLARLVADRLGGGASALEPVVRAAMDASAEELRIVALLLARELEGDGIDDQNRKRLERLAIEYCERAPAPSFGFAALADRLFAHGLSDAALIATRRALDGGGEIDPNLRDRLLGRSVDAAVRSGEDEKMREWLERARPAD